MQQSNFVINNPFGIFFSAFRNGFHHYLPVLQQNADYAMQPVAAFSGIIGACLGVYYVGYGSFCAFGGVVGATAVVPSIIVGAILGLLIFSLPILNLVVASNVMSTIVNASNYAFYSVLDNFNNFFEGNGFLFMYHIINNNRNFPNIYSTGEEPQPQRPRTFVCNSHTDNFRPMSI